MNIVLVLGNNYALLIIRFKKKKKSLFFCLMFNIGLLGFVRNKKNKVKILILVEFKFCYFFI